jgi:peptide/nickel transport system ATP-binding protein
MERLQKFEKGDKKTNIDKVINSFKQVQLSDPKRIFKAYPNELSGGQKQRVMIAMALICNPQLLIADEPTTALDVTVQKEILSLLKTKQKSNKMSILFISHDLSLVAEFADRVMVMHRGELIENEKTKILFNNPRFAYTRGLLFARPQADKRLERLPSISDFTSDKKSFKVVSNASRKKSHQILYAQSPILEVENLYKEYPLNINWFKDNKNLRAVENFSFKLYPGETLGLVGESGCGKSTVSRALVNLDSPTSGRILYQGREISGLDRSKRMEIQLVFQDPLAALHPLKTIGDVIAEPLEIHQLVNYKKQRTERVVELLEQVGMKVRFLNRYPHELSGGQRQRVVIARALATQPRLLILDEAVAALDISIQAQVLNLLNDLKKQLQLSYLFISHDLNVVKYMADRIMVMEKGILVEEGEADELYDRPKHAYTQKLIAALPRI